MDLHEGDICLVCETGTLSKALKELEFEYKGHNILFNKSVYFCPECEEEFLDTSDQKEIDKELTDFRRRVEGLLTSSEIKQIRKKFGYTQIEFANILKVGKKNFARYECGQATQSRSMDNLLRVLNHSPISIEVIGGEYSRVNSANVFNFKMNTPGKISVRQKTYHIDNENFANVTGNAVMPADDLLLEYSGT